VDWGSTLANLGYKPQIQTTAGATYTRRYSPVVFWVLYILLFPIGLLLLLARPTQTLTLTFEEEGDGTRIAVSGIDDRARRRFLQAGFVEAPAHPPTPL
jgi:hypothetical protein